METPETPHPDLCHGPSRAPGDQPVELTADAGIEPARPSRMRRMVMFPLTRIVIGLFLVILAAVAASKAARGFLAWAVGGPVGKMSFAVALPMALAALAAYLLFVRWVERRRATELDPVEAPRGLAAGVGLGVGIMGLTVGTIWILGGYDVAGWNGVRALMLPLSIAIMSGFFEELVFRGVVFRIAEEALGTWTALAATAALFGAAHLVNTNATVWSAIAIALEAGLLLGAAYVASRSLWLPIGLHLGWNFAQAGLLGATVSGIDIRGMVTARFTGPDLLTGGAFGPEASIPAVVIGVASAVLLLSVAAERGRLVPFRRRRRENAPADPVASPYGVSGREPAQPPPDPTTRV